MAVPDAADEDDAPDELPESEPPVPVTAVRTSTDRTVFTEDDNDDAWIATDLTVELER
ncbi:MAG: hypothetical protein ABEJ79_09850 [Halolamina sp.]